MEYLNLTWRSLEMSGTFLQLIDQFRSTEKRSGVHISGQKWLLIFGCVHCQHEQRDEVLGKTGESLVSTCGLPGRGSAGNYASKTHGENWFADFAERSP
jgi:hypothetical protein